MIPAPRLGLGRRPQYRGLRRIAEDVIPEPRAAADLARATRGRDDGPGQPVGPQGVGVGREDRGRILGLDGVEEPLGLDLVWVAPGREGPDGPAIREGDLPRPGQRRRLADRDVRSPSELNSMSTRCVAIRRVLAKRPDRAGLVAEHRRRGIGDVGPRRGDRLLDAATRRRRPRPHRRAAGRGRTGASSARRPGRRRPRRAATRPEAGVPSIQRATTSRAGLAASRSWTSGIASRARMW